MALEPYTLRQAQRLVTDAWSDGESRRRRWRLLNRLYRTGRVDESILADYTPGQIENELGASLDTINLVLPHINIIVASCTARDPRFVTTAWGSDPTDEDRAAAARALITHFWEKADATDSLRSATKDMVLLGNGFLKVAWHRLERELDRHEDDIADDLAAVVLADQQTALAEGLEATSMDDLRALVPSTDSIVDVDQPLVEWVAPHDIVVPPNARRLRDARWIAQRVVLPLDEIQDNPAYENTDDLVANMRLGEDAIADQTIRDTWGGTGSGETSAEVERPYEYVELWEFYDRRTDTLKVFTRDGELPLYDGELPYAHRLPPFVHLRNYDDAEDFYAFGDGDNIAHLAELLQEAFTEAMDGFRRAGNIYVGNRNYMDDDVADKIQTAEHDELILGDFPQGTPISEVVAAIERKPLPAEIYQAGDMIRDAMAQVLSLNDFQQAGVGADRMSATAAAITDGVASLRAQDKIQAVERASEDVARLILALLQEFLEADVAQRVAGPNGVSWVHVAPEDIQGEFKITIESGSTRAVNPATKAQQGQQLWQMLPTFVQMNLDPLPAARQAMRDMGYNPDQILKALPPQPPAPGQDPGQDPTAGAPVDPAALGAPAGPPPGGDTASILAALTDGAANPATAGGQSLYLGGPDVPAQTEGEIAL